jgi:hypothetical protein
MGSVKKEIPATPAMTEPVNLSSPEVVEAAKLEAARLKRRRGWRSTMATGPEGVTEPAITRKETLG